MLNIKITDVDATEILDSRGNPTVFVSVKTDAGACGCAGVPSGASTGVLEALELRDGDKKRFGGKGVLKAVNNVKTTLSKLLIGENVLNQTLLDLRMIEADGSDNKAKLGANAILGVSIAIARAAAASIKMPLFTYIGGVSARELPCPMMNLINGGMHANNGLEYQEFMIRPIGAPSFSEALRWGAEVFHSLQSILKKKNLSTAVGDEGGFAPVLSSNSEALELLMEAIENAGFIPGAQISLALDCAASSFYDAGTHKYGNKRTAEEQIEELKALCKSFPIDSIEDGMAEDDWDGWASLTKQLGQNVQLVGDDIFVTNPSIIQKGIACKTANSVLIKVNQIGSLTETISAVKLSQTNSYSCIMSHRSGETEDTTIADLSVALNCGQIKTGSLSRSERVAKYNRLLQIEKMLGKAAIFKDSNKFSKVS